MTKEVSNRDIWFLKECYYFANKGILFFTFLGDRPPLPPLTPITLRVKALSQILGLPPGQTFKGPLECCWGPRAATWIPSYVPSIKKQDKLSLGPK